MRCSKCEFENPAGMKFCGKCRTALGLTCPDCSFENPPGFDFCGQCAAALHDNAGITKGKVAAAKPVTTVRVVAEDASATLEGERKTVTALFADIKGSTEMMEDLDPESARAIIDPALKLMIDAAHRYDGYVVQSTGDGIFALFGAPVAHEDHPQRALFAALRMQEEMSLYSAKVVAEGGMPMEARIGVNTGEVVVRSITTGDGHTEYTPIGHTANLASRMQAVAPTRSIAISEHTRKFVEGYFQLKTLGPTRVKGVSQPVNVFEVVGLGALRTRLDLSRARGFSKFVGRDREMATLEGALDVAIAGNGQVVGVVAEAGTGKSRLCFEFVERCRSRGVRVSQGHCPAHGKTIPYLPLLEVLRDIFGIGERDSDHEARRKIAGELLLLDDAFQTMLPILFDFMGVSDPTRPSPAMSPEGRQQMLFAFVRHLTEARSAREPAVIFLDDLHWIDPGSDAFLAHAVAAVQNARTLYLVNFRPEYRADWMRKPYYQQVALLPLGSDSTREMLADLLGTDASVQGLPARVHQRTGGNPFFIEEVVQSMVESGRLTGARGSYQLVGSLDAVEIPATVQTVLASRIDRLGSDQKHLLQTASVIGKEFSGATLVAVAAADDHANLSAAMLASSLDVLRDAEFIYETALYPEVEYAFKHPLTQQVAYDTLLRERRARVHAAVARAIAGIYAEKLDEKAALLAHHWEHAGEAWQAALWHKRAAQWAGVTNAAEGLKHWERVRSLVRTLPHTTETLQLGVTACLGNLSLGWRLGTPTAEAADIFEEGRRLAEEAGDVRTLAALNGVYACVLGLVGGASDEYVRYSREATQLADQTNDQGLQLAERSFLAFACVFAGCLVEGIEVCETACRLPPDPALGAEFTSYSPFLGILNAHAWMLSRLGRINEATAVCERAEHLARKHGDNEVLTWLQLPRIELDTCCANSAAARDHARYALETGEKSATPQARMSGLIVLGIAHRLNFEWDEAVGMLEDAAHAVVGGANRQFEGWVRAELAKALLGRGDLDRAEQEAQTAVTVSQAQHSRCDEVRANLALAHTQLHRADAPALVRAGQALVRAQELIDETGAQAYQPEVHECRSHLARLRGEAPIARCEIEEARRLYTAMGAAAQVERLTRELA